MKPPEKLKVCEYDLLLGRFDAEMDAHFNVKDCAMYKAEYCLMTHLPCKVYEYSLSNLSNNSDHIAEASKMIEELFDGFKIILGYCDPQDERFEVIRKIAYSLLCYFDNSFKDYTESPSSPEKPDRAKRIKAPKEPIDPNKY